MIISDLKLIEKGTRVRIVALCTIGGGIGEDIYFEFDSKYRTYINTDYSSFAAALLLPSMKLGQDLTIKGAISERLFHGMHEIMDIALEWNVGFNPIKILADSVRKDTECGSDIVTTFSGGVDSFYTWLNHKKDNVPVSTMMFINGFDISLDNQALYERTVRNIKDIARVEGADLVEAESNIRPFIDPILNWGLSHGGCLAATALCLRNGIKLMYIPSSYTIEQEHPWGSHRLLDEHWSTESITFKHDGFDTSRVGKVVKLVGHSETALDYLRVCWKEEEGSYNCGKCNKCLRTMVNLYVASTLNKSRTFPNSIDLNLLENANLDEADVMFVKENIEALREIEGSSDLIKAYEKSLYEYLHPGMARRIKRNISKFDTNYFNDNIHGLITKFSRKK